MALLSTLTALPAAGALAVSASNRNPKLARTIALCTAVLALVLALVVVAHFDRSSAALQLEERYAWVPWLNIDYRVAVDGLGVTMLLLSSIVTLIAMGASWKVSERAALYFTLMLALESCLFGAFTALNFVHWFTYWELSLIPAFFLIRLWGGPRRGPAATQFLVYTMVGSVAMLLAFLAIYFGTRNFDFIELGQLAQSGQLMPAVLTNLGVHGALAKHLPELVFLGVFLGFAVKVPLVPFHTWLPSAYSEAPSGTTALLTGAMSKMGVYGFLRIVLPIFAPQMQQFLTPLLWLAVASIALSAWAALAQKDLKRIFAYSSINHLGYCMLAIFAASKFVGVDGALAHEQYAAMNGAILQMFNHGLTAAALFWFLALMEERSGGVLGLNDFGGLRRIAPVFSGLMGIALFSSLGLPGLNGFVGEFLIFKGSWPLATWATSLSVIGLMLTAVVILGMIQRVFAGPVNERWSSFTDITSGETAALALPIALMFVLGLCPQLLVSIFNSTAVHLVPMWTF